MFYKRSVVAEVKDLENLTLIYEDSRIILKNKEYESLSSKKGDVMVILHLKILSLIQRIH